MHSFATAVGPAALATKEFVIDENGEGGRYVRIVGRKSGLVDWLLSLMGIDTTTVFEVYSDHIRFTQANFSGRVTTLLPMSSVSATSSGYFKPVLYLILGVPLILAFGLGLILIIYYFLHKTLSISVLTHSGSGAVIAFKRSVIEGIKVDESQAQRVTNIINHLTLAALAR